MDQDRQALGDADEVEDFDGKDVSKRNRSTIEFPYVSLEAAEEVAAAIYRRCGHGSCEIDELAAEMSQSVSGAFRQKTAAAKTFGVVEKDGRSSFTLSDIGRKLSQEDTALLGRVEAFLSVPLYSAIYEKYRGHNLPPAKALEREMEAIGVSSKQTDKARQAFERSAQHAGFFDAGRERLVKPRLDIQRSVPDHPEPCLVPERSVPEPSKVDPIIQGLLARLPETGAVWPVEKREIWLNLLKGSFELIYKDAPKGGHLSE